MLDQGMESLSDYSAESYTISKIFALSQGGSNRIA